MMRKLGLILGMVFVLTSVAFAASPTALYMIQRLQYVEQLTGVPQTFIAARPMTPEQVDSIWGIDTDSTAWQSRANAFLAANTFAGTSDFSGAVSVGGTETYGIDFDAGTFASGDLRLQNAEVISNYTNGVIGLTATTVAASGRVTATDFAASDSLLAVTGDFSGKITGAAGLGITGAGAFSTRITASDIAVTDSVIGVTGDFSGVVSPLSVTLPGGGTIADPASPGTTVTITETNIALAGAVTATTAAIGSSGSVLTKVWVTGTGASDSLLFIVGNDTFVATQVRVGH
jgi:hypothetical protein